MIAFRVWRPMRSAAEGGIGQSFSDDRQSVGGDQPRAELGATEVDRQDRPIGELVHVAPILARAGYEKRRAGSRRASRWS